MNVMLADLVITLIFRQVFNFALKKGKKRSAIVIMLGIRLATCFLFNDYDQRIFFPSKSPSLSYPTRWSMH